jgi:hypothetical protein
MTQSNGKAQLSTRWHKDIKETVNKYNFILEGTFDSILTSNARHKCDFCGQPLRYVAMIEGTLLESTISRVSNITLLISKGTMIYFPNDQKYEIGLDCLGLVLGSNWTGYGEAKRQIKVLKTAAAIESRKIKYAEKYPKMITWLTEVVELTNNSFLSAMLKILNTGSTVFTPKMRDEVKKCFADKTKYDIPKLKKQSTKVEAVLGNIQYLIDMIKEVDVLDEGDTNNTLLFVESLSKWVEVNNFLTPKQIAGLKKIRKRYIHRKKNWVALKKEYLKRCEIPF